jgi:hypothetical protein
MARSRSDTAIDEEFAAARHDVELPNRATRQDIEQIVRRSLELPRLRPPRRVARLQFVEHAGKAFKVRAYPDRAEAQRIFELLKKAPRLFPPCCGRLGRFLVLKVVPGAYLEESQEAFAQIGASLAGLSRVATLPATNEEFADLCRDLEHARVFRPRTIEMLRRCYSSHCYTSMHWGLEYFDPMPNNFLITDTGRCIVIDEKHLLAGPRGVSLVKPRRKFSTRDFETLKTAYCNAAGFAELEDPDYQRFVMFYYAVSLLALYARSHRRSAIWTNAIFLRLRRAVLEIAGAGTDMRMIEEAVWFVPYRWARARSFVRRAADFVTRRFWSER